ncbi:unnamed protein product [Caenorhabditis auriculariae]|uniref:Protein kinase domain-containing protein n=1 Tax=Caenorhabditis auriculariae TaxID=2777116 RepID=A0A8S1GRK9_9PELO|nr:unnamed protein product [Caenorhabditis auriculariae]
MNFLNKIWTALKEKINSKETIEKSFEQTTVEEITVEKRPMAPEPPKEMNKVAHPIGNATRIHTLDPMCSRKTGFSRVLDGLAKRQLEHDFQLERAAQTYDPIKNIGAGAFGIVCMAKERNTENYVAIKKIGHASATPTLARRTLREIRVLRFLNHPNIVTLRDIFRTQGPLGTDVYLVMDLMETNLHRVIYDTERELREDEIMQCLRQLLVGLQYLHKAQIAHRDLKPSNLLVNWETDSSITLRIADFGMAKLAEKEKRNDEADEHCFYMTQHVATLPYRAPELLFVMPEHSTAVDMWAVGCILGEMYKRQELFPARSVQSQIYILVFTFGKPSAKILREIRCERTKQLIEKYNCDTSVSFRELIPYGEDGLSCNALDFVSRLLTIDPDNRMDINEALTHPFIQDYFPQIPNQPTCPFRVKNDMKNVEVLKHHQLTAALCKDVKSAENSYNAEMYSGDYPYERIRAWSPGDFERERNDEIFGGTRTNPRIHRGEIKYRQPDGFKQERQLTGICT